MEMVLREVMGQHPSIESVQGMNVTGSSVTSVQRSGRRPVEEDATLSFGNQMTLGIRGDLERPLHDFRLRLHRVNTGRRQIAHQPQNPSLGIQLGQVPVSVGGQYGKDPTLGHPALEGRRHRRGPAFGNSGGYAHCGA